jgi:hypothetical protein
MRGVKKMRTAKQHAIQIVKTKPLSIGRAIIVHDIVEEIRKDYRIKENHVIDFLPRLKSSIRQSNHIVNVEDYIKEVIWQIRHVKNENRW